jgi:hypothetical protein
VLTYGNSTFAIAIYLLRRYKKGFFDIAAVSANSCSLFVTKKVLYQIEIFFLRIERRSAHGQEYLFLFIYSTLRDKITPIICIQYKHNIIIPANGGDNTDKTTVKKQLLWALLTYKLHTNV